MLIALGQLGQACQALECVAVGLESSLGVDHPVTLTALANLAVAKRRAGQLDDAIDLAARVADERARVLGAYHPHTLESLLNLTTALLDASLEAEGEHADSLRSRAKQRLMELEEQRMRLSQRARTSLDANVGKTMAAEERWAEAAVAFGRARENAAGGEGTWIDAYLKGRYVHARGLADGLAEGRRHLDLQAREELESCIQTLVRLRGPDDRYTAALKDLLPE